jgi:hypothetical protein
MGLLGGIVPGGGSWGVGVSAGGTLGGGGTLPGGGNCPGGVGAGPGAGTEPGGAAPGLPPGAAPPGAAWVNTVALNPTLQMSAVNAVAFMGAALSLMSTLPCAPITDTPRVPRATVGARAHCTSDPGSLPGDALPPS